MVPSTLHQCFKYVDSSLTVRRQFADKKPFQVVGVYYSDAALYEEGNQPSKGDSPRELEEDAADESQRGILQIIDGQIELINGARSSSPAIEGGAGRKRVRGGPPTQQVEPRKARRNMIYLYNMVKAEETTLSEESEREPPTED